MNKRKLDDIEWQASLRGVKLKNTKSRKKKEDVSLSETQESNLEAIINSRLSKGKK